MPKELYKRLGDIVLYKYLYPKGKGSKLIMELEPIGSLLGRKFLWGLCVPEGICSLQSAVGENVHVEWSGWIPAGPATVRVLLNGNEGWKLVAKYVERLWKNKVIVYPASYSRIEEVLLHHLFRSWDVRGPEVFAVPISDELSLEENIKGVQDLMDHRVISMYVSGIRWCRGYLESLQKGLESCNTKNGTLSEEDLYRRRKIEAYFVLAENPGLRARIRFPVL